MEEITIENLSFQYPKASQPVLQNLTFSVQRGEFFTLCGPSGCGKTTLLRQLKPALAPFGKRKGTIFFQGIPLETLDERTQSEKIGFVRQNVEHQIVTDKVWHELAFGLESLGYETQSIRRRTAEMASFFGIQNWFHKKVEELSGGQKQLLSLASVMVMQPSLLILDEPTAQLDPIAATEFLNAVKRINQEFGTTIIMTEHRLEEVFPMSDRVIVLEEGRIIAENKPEQIGRDLLRMGNSMFASMPVPMRIWMSVEKESVRQQQNQSREQSYQPDEACPITAGEGRRWFDRYRIGHELYPMAHEITDAEERTCKTSAEVHEGKTPTLTVSDVWFRYEKNSPDVLKGIDLQAYPGECLAILGENGVGKSTLLSLLTGENRPYRGKIRLTASAEITKGKNDFRGIALLPQEPQTLFTKKTVKEDMETLISGKQGDSEERKNRMEEITELCGLKKLLESHPYDLSGGEQQRAALAKILLTSPDIILMDEPTKGLDGEWKQILSVIIKRLLAEKKTVILVSHDIEFCARTADRCLMLFDGIAVSEGNAMDFFAHNCFYTTTANRMVRHVEPYAVTEEDVLRLCLGDGNGGDSQKKKGRGTAEDSGKSNTVQEMRKESPKKTSLPVRTMLGVMMNLVAIPVTIYFGMAFLDDKKYLFISLLIMFECMAPFFLIFEGRNPRARELVMLAALCALGVAGRLVFSMLPQFKPVMAIVILSGAAFGAETGFLVGAITMLASNLFFGQGPWTPWQMFSMGLIGFLSGLLFFTAALPKKKCYLCGFGFLAAMVIWGGIMNPASALLAGVELNKGVLVSYYIYGFPMDLVQAAATVIFLFLGAGPVLEKLERVRVKYGIET